MPPVKSPMEQEGSSVKARESIELCLLLKEKLLLDRSKSCHHWLPLAQPHSNDGLIGYLHAQLAGKNSFDNVFPLIKKPSAGFMGLG